MFLEAWRLRFRDVRVELRKTAFAWKALAILICCLWVSLVVVEGLWGDTRVVVRKISPAAVAILAPDLKGATGTDYALLRTCSWQTAIVADHCQFLRLIGETAYLTGISVTTIGFGDVVPTTWAGRVLCVLDAIVGFLAFGLYVGQIMYGLRGHIGFVAPLPPK
jgi:hypothetical protein